MNRKRLAVSMIALLLTLTLPELVAAQQVNPVAASPQMRHFWHVFAAYAIAWILIFGWAVAIFRRLKRVEDLLDAR